jgi:hypothetical protein
MVSLVVVEGNVKVLPGTISLLTIISKPPCTNTTNHDLHSYLPAPHPFAVENLHTVKKNFNRKQDIELFSRPLDLLLRIVDI